MTNIVMTNMLHIRMIIKCSDNTADGWDDEWEREHSTNKTKGIKAKTKDIKYEQSDLLPFVLFNMLNSSQKFEKSSCLIKN